MFGQPDSQSNIFKFIQQNIHSFSNGSIYKLHPRETINSAFVSRQFPQFSFLRLSNVNIDKLIESSSFVVTSISSVLLDLLLADKDVYVIGNKSKAFSCYRLTS